MALVMFVDDSQTALASTRLAVQGMPIEVEQHTHAASALEAIAGGKLPDLIISDLNMPEIDGFAFLKELRSGVSTKRIPVLMLTTETSSEIKQQGKALGLTGWVVKPFNPRQLVQAINRVLRIG